ncbi:hypothetical protein COT75_04405 [Candidatus Beckwithbacteria bacterium CG10_big_fil_rev_8_21_14_0_10_34_10]|uniref:Uncharacterized protein n=1 Tax=Candidatus Beckwithbacteria bacterium CG10_big_fil_rev_8_21_14_0_10_34_10 TaxID=1974495 RepID=A0A2H0W8A8_9BACT|nr:MAG: hypothetical protein COT75_04405 [Candidatus Beckwithbacteria bacterium CG10_big_fil_rev_8_21_14_0_10_34_10]
MAEGEETLPQPVIEPKAPLVLNGQDQVGQPIVDSDLGDSSIDPGVEDVSDPNLEQEPPSEFEQAKEGAGRSIRMAYDQEWRPKIAGTFAEKGYQAAMARDQSNPDSNAYHPKAKYDGDTGNFVFIDKGGTEYHGQNATLVDTIETLREIGASENLPVDLRQAAIKQAKIIEQEIPDSIQEAEEGESEPKDNNEKLEPKINTSFTKAFQINEVGVLESGVSFKDKFQDLLNQVIEGNLKPKKFLNEIKPLIKKDLTEVEIENQIVFARNQFEAITGTSGRGLNLNQLETGILKILPSKPENMGKLEWVQKLIQGQPGNSRLEKVIMFLLLASTLGQAVQGAANSMTKEAVQAS